MANTTKGSGKTKKKTSASGTAKKKQTQTTARKTTAKKSSTAKRTSGTRKNTVREPMDEGALFRVLELVDFTLLLRIPEDISRSSCLRFPAAEASRGRNQKVSS